MEHSQLQLRPAVRAGSGGRTERRYLDFVVDGRALLPLVGSPDLIGGVGWGAAEGERLYIERLLLRAATDVPSGRVSIYVCPECGDIGCGAVTARIAKTSDAFVWSDFAFENNDDSTLDERYDELGPFAFNKTEYWQLLSARLTEL
jgi:hypothetical protein